MHQGQYVFTQITRFLPKRFFERLAVKYDDHTRGWSLSHWSHLLVLMFGQLLACRSLRELADITIAHDNKTFFLGFGRIEPLKCETEDDDKMQLHINIENCCTNFHCGEKAKALRLLLFTNNLH